MINIPHLRQGLYRNVEEFLMQRDLHSTNDETLSLDDARKEFAEYMQAYMDDGRSGAPTQKGNK